MSEEITFEETEKKELDEFDKAFTEALEGKTQSVPEGDVDPDPDKTKDATIPEPKPEDDPLLSMDEGNNPDAADPDPNSDSDKDQDPVKTREQELEEELAKEKAKMATWSGRITAANERAKRAEAEAEALRQAKKKTLEEEAKANLLDDDDEKALKEFIDEFPDLHKPIITLVKQELLPIIGQMIDDRLGKIEPRIETIDSKLKEDVTAAHFKAIKDAHPDYEQIADSGALDKWIKTKPSYIQEALNKVKAEGEAQEVIDMFTEYKTDTGQKPDKDKDLASDNSSNPGKAKDLLAVPASHSRIVTNKTQKDKDDFDAGWDDAIKEK